MRDEKEKVINEIVVRMNLESDKENELKNVLYICLHDYTLTQIKDTDLIIANENVDIEAVRMFFVSKRIQGCTDRTIDAYSGYIRCFLQFTNKPLAKITTNDIRYYMAVKKERDKISDVGVDNIRRVLSSFFAWLYEEEYISKNPMFKIKKVRMPKYVKKAFSDIEIEKLRHKAQGDIRLTAIMEVMLSTGCRISEISGMNRSDLDGDEIKVYGKGKKERIVYLNAKARLALQEYLQTRTDDNEAMFVSMDQPHDRLKTSGMGIDIRMLGRAAGIKDTHPHRFRRTAATMALNRGMPIDQVQIMLGHESIETTTIYAVSAQETIKTSHKKYVV